MHFRVTFNNQLMVRIDLMICHFSQKFNHPDCLSLRSFQAKRLMYFYSWLISLIVKTISSLPIVVNGSVTYSIAVQHLAIVEHNMNDVSV